MAYKPDKHGRDHCPGGEDPIPCWPTGLKPDLVLVGGGSATHNTWHHIRFDVVWYDPARVSNGTPPWTWTISDFEDTGWDRYVITTNVEGWYAADLHTSWDQVTTGGSQEFGAATQQLTWTDINSTTFESDIRTSADWFDADLHPFFEMVDRPFLHDFRVINIPGDVGDWRVRVKQTTGVERSYGAILKLWFFEEEDLSAVWEVDSF